MFPRDGHPTSVLVTGASGFIGKHFVRKLTEHGLHVTAVYRRPNPPDFFYQEHCDLLDFVRMDITEPQGDLFELCRGHEFVVHTAAKTGDWGNDASFREINVDATANLLSAAREAGIKKFIYMSSIAVHGFGNHRATSEEGPYYPLITPYQRTKLEAERIVLGANTSDFSTTAIRPGNVYGPGDTTTFFPIFDALRQGVMGYLGNGESLTCPVFVADLVDAVLLALQSDVSSGEVFNIVSDDVITWTELLEEASRLLEVKPPSIHLPSGAAKIGASLCSSIYRLFRISSAPPLTQYRVEQLTHDYNFSSGHAKSLLGYNPKIDYKTGLRITVHDYMCR
jgi:2-alkyl-3-oxoalkanoate reductase